MFKTDKLREQFLNHTGSIKDKAICCVSNNLPHHKVNGQCFILSLNVLNELIHPWLSLRRFNIMWLPFFVSNGTLSYLQHFIYITLF